MHEFSDSDIKENLDLSEKYLMLLAGPTGSGKNFFTKQLVKKGVPLIHISAGDKLRNFVKNPKTTQQSMIAEMMRKGLLVPTEIVVQEIFPELIMAGEKLIVLDGFPRNMNQVLFLLESNLIKIDFKKIMVVHINRSCQRCLDQILASKDRGVRDDDKSESIQFRLEKYQIETAPALEKLQSIGVPFFETGDVSDLQTVVPRVIDYFDLHSISFMRCANLMM